ncbi:acetyl-CoA acyltransferase [Salinibacterium amurskyense]|uniref:Acetyl-CoA acyltransferase n=1 Tax=Salinibacterium amurskyense TaxID=205941 RepID=A0A2M9D300_9MICO|nr:thiolase family protein [Salinibacterium amurskyense]PJJ78570.1 acetyl-CoA acyltransferase [Salinibacterium amurskyense]RLQ80657.1 thiolase family protein [Salinibacterium amurskyense]GHD83005.1 acetyl-CoA acyltransferase [Salinibacterium amurskyense]
MTTAVIVDAIRTPSGRGKPGGALSSEHPVDLLAVVLRSLVDRHDLDPATIDDVMGGCVTQSGRQAANVTRTAVLAAGFPESVPATTIDRQCGSSQQAAHFAAQSIMAGVNDIVIACGVELMSTHPLGQATLGQGGMSRLIRNRYPEGFVTQGISAELIAARWGLERDDLDVYAALSHARAAAADFSSEILPLAGLDRDETVRPGTTAEKLSGLSPVFYDAKIAGRFPEIQWRVTAGNSSPLTDGASAALIMSEERAAALGLKPRARFHSFAVVGSDPIEMLTGIIPATHRILERSGIRLDQLDSIEVNEAFASVALAWLQEFPVDPTIVNPRGGAIALGHALGSSGTRLLTTLVNNLDASGGRFGLQVMCEGGGMANATLIERL